jgi:transposase
MDSIERMDGGFLSEQERLKFRSILKCGSTKQRFARRANAILLLDKGMSCAGVAEVLFLDDDTIRSFYKSYVGGGVEGLERFESGGSSCDLNDEQIKSLVDWVDETHPTTRRIVGAWLKRVFDVSYSKAGLIALLNRVGLVFRKPVLVPRVIDAEAQSDWIKAYEALLNEMTPNEMAMFMDAVHPAHQSRAVGCWTKRDAPPLALASNSGRDRINVHGAIDLATGQTVMVEEDRINAETTIKLLGLIEQRNPTMTSIFVFVDQAAYHKSKVVRDWLDNPERRVKLRLVPTYCPHLNPIERLWGEMHRWVTHNTCYATKNAFRDAILKFLTETIPTEFHKFRSRITDNFLVKNASDFRVLR